MKPWFASVRGAQFFLLLGVGLMLLFGALEWRFPDAARLETAAGRVTWWQETRGALYFTVAARPGNFVLHAKGDADGRLRAAVRDAAGLYPVAVRFDRGQSARSGLAPGEFYTAYGIAVGGKEVSALDVVRASYRRDNLVALVMGALFAAWGGRRLSGFRRAGALADDNPAGARRAGGGRPPSRRSR